MRFRSVNKRHCLSVLTHSFCFFNKRECPNKNRVRAFLSFPGTREKGACIMRYRGPTVEVHAGIPYSLNLTTSIMTIEDTQVTATIAQTTGAGT